MGSCTCPTLDTWATARITMGGLWAWILITLPMCMLGPQPPSVAAFGDTVVLPATARTCSWSRVTPLTQGVTGWAAKRSFACKLDRPGPVNLPTIGCLPIGSVSTTAIPILAASAPRWLTCPELRLPSLCLRWVKIAMLFCWTATISVVSLQLWPRRTWEGSKEEHQLSLTAPVRERILAFTTMPVPSGPTESLQQIHQRSCLPGAKVRTDEARPG